MFLKFACMYSMCTTGPFPIKALAISHMSLGGQTKKRCSGINIAVFRVLPACTHNVCVSLPWTLDPHGIGVTLQYVGFYTCYFATDACLATRNNITM